MSNQGMSGPVVLDKSAQPYWDSIENKPRQKLPSHNSTRCAERSSGQTLRCSSRQHPCDGVDLNLCPMKLKVSVCSISRQNGSIAGETTSGGLHTTTRSSQSALAAPPAAAMTLSSSLSCGCQTVPTLSICSPEHHEKERVLQNRPHVQYTQS